MIAILLIIPIIIMIVGIVILFFGFKRWKKYHLIIDTPTSKIRSMAMGLVEIIGVITRSSYIRAPFSNSECVYYYYKIEEYRRHTHTNSKGHTHTTYRWDTIDSGQRRVPFFVNDQTGEAYVYPNEADITAPLQQMYYQYARHYGLFDMIIGSLRDWDSGRSNYLDTGAWQLVPYNSRVHSNFHASVGDRKYYEYFLNPGLRLYIMGTAANDQNAPNNVVIKKGENEPTFMITYKSEEELAKSLKWQTTGLLIGGCAVIVVGAIIGWFLSGVG
jgi:hypothetical protein